MSIAARFEKIRDRVGKAVRRAGREHDSVRLIAVTKTRSADEIAQAVEAGVTDIGENKVQEAELKKPQLACAPRWHLIGHLQKNKARKAVELFDVVHTVDSVAIGERLDRLAGELERTQPVLVQVDLAEEETKFGISEDMLFEGLQTLTQCTHLRVDGLMLLPPYSEDANDVRPYFRRLRELSQQARERDILTGTELSMGMSHDFEVAIEEGATCVRVGTAIFGARPQKSQNTEQLV